MPIAIRRLTAHDLAAIAGVAPYGVTPADGVIRPAARPLISSFRFRWLLGLGALASGGDALFEGCPPQTYRLTQDSYHMSEFQSIGATVLANGDRVELLAGRYRHGGQTAIVPREAATGAPYATLSANLVASNAAIPANAFAVKDWGENAGLAPQLLATGLFADTGERIPSDFVEAPVWTIRDPAHVPPLPREPGRTRGRGR